jgi:hypothetical protein
MNMKTTTSLMIASIAAAFVTFNSDIGAAEKGAEKLAKRNAAAPAIEKTMVLAPAMKCTFVTRTHVDYSARGAVKPLVLSTADTCASCETKIVTKGIGKSSTQVAEHKCGATGCCPVKKI